MKHHELLTDDAEIFSEMNQVSLSQLIAILPRIKKKKSSFQVEIWIMDNLYLLTLPNI